jgi:hypothetical protein
LSIRFQRNDPKYGNIVLQLGIRARRDRPRVRIQSLQVSSSPEVPSLPLKIRRIHFLADIKILRAEWGLLFQ